jgi:Domain of unknown function (DUF397)
VITWPTLLPWCYMRGAALVRVRATEGGALMGDGDPRPHWHKSQRSGGDGCVECAVEPGVVMIRDSKDPDGPTLAFDHATWRGFVDDVKAGAFDRP